jgi:hypothetical protein
MKKLTILRSVLLVLFGVLAINLDLALGDVRLQSKPNWLTIIPAFAISATLFGLGMRKQLKAAESGTRKAEAELAQSMPVLRSMKTGKSTPSMPRRGAPLGSAGLLRQ